MNRTESLEKARERMTAKLKQQGFDTPTLEAYSPREGAFALTQNIGEHHSIYIEALFGNKGKQEFFRLNLGFGPADVKYDDLPFLGDDEGKGIRMPFFRAMLVKKSARMQQRIYNMFLSPPSWNHAASDTFYYASDAELLTQIDDAASLVARVLPGFIDHLKRNNMAAPRLKSPYKFLRR